ncbi:hypothetical protein ES705_35457 [subsurface metagenome]
MRAITPPGISQISGHEFKGSRFVFYTRNNRTFVRIQRGPTYRHSVPQKAICAAHAAATKGFQNITDEQRKTWVIFAKKLPRSHMGISYFPTDREAYTATNVYRQLNEDPLTSYAPEVKPPAFSFQLTAVEYCNVQPGIIIEFSHTASVSEAFTFLLKASHSYASNARRARKNDYRMAGSTNHFSFCPVQPSPMRVFVPYTPLVHKENAYIHVSLKLLSSDYFPGQEIPMKVKLSSHPVIWRRDPASYIQLNTELGDLDFYLDSQLKARLHSNGNLSLAGQVIQYEPSEAPLSRDLLFHPILSPEIRFSYKTKGIPAWKTAFSLDVTGDLFVYGELEEFFNLEEHEENLFIHPYRTPRKLQISCNLETPALIYFVDEEPQNTLCLREVREYEL